MNLKKRVKHIYLRNDDNEAIEKLKRVMREHPLTGEFTTNYIEFARKPFSASDRIAGIFSLLLRESYHFF